MLDEDDNDDESDKHLEARIRRYSCLKSGNLNVGNTRYM